jgi:hypothetical protein
MTKRIKNNLIYWVIIYLCPVYTGERLGYDHCELPRSASYRLVATVSPTLTSDRWFTCTSVYTKDPQRC